MIGRTNVGGGGGGQTWSIRGWCETVGLSYGLLDDITEADMRTLMTKYASVAYFREWYASEPSMIDQFIANTYAMKWIGLRDYICDKLMAVSDFKTKALASTNWEYILKDHVPVMTSDTAPYGTVTCSYAYSSAFNGYKVFDGDNSTMWITGYDAIYASNAWVAYQFVNPICVRKMHLVSNDNRPSVFHVEASNDNTNWVKLVENYTIPGTNYGCDFYLDIPNDNYYLYYRLYVKTPIYATQTRVNTLQFYGRSLNVSVPSMTSYTAPYGQVSANGDDGGNNSAYSAFSDNGYAWIYRSQSVWIQYQFVRAFRPKFYYLKNAGGNYALTKASLLGSNDGSSWTTLVSEINFSGAYSEAFGIIPTDSDYKYLRITSSNTGSSGGGLTRIKFFCIDYSERTNRTYLYDHGLELVPMSMGVQTGLDGLGTVTEYDTFVTCDCPDYTHDQAPYATDNTINLTSYSEAWMDLDCLDYHPTIGGSFGYLSINTARGFGGSGLVAFNVCQLMDYSSADALVMVDLSSVSGSYYVCGASAVLADSAQRCKINIKEIWLE